MNDAELLRAIRKVPPESIDATMRAQLSALNDGGRFPVAVYEIPAGPIVIVCGQPSNAKLIAAFRDALLHSTKVGGTT